MGRAKGKHGPRRPDVTISPGTPEAEDIGLSDRTKGQASPRIAGETSPIPGGRDHLGNHPSVPQKVPIKEPRDTYRGVMAHGVSPQYHDAHERAENERGPNDFKPLVPAYAKPAHAPPAPVPVYVVESGQGVPEIRSSAPHSLTLPASTGEPVRICGRDRKRKRILVLNESTSSDIRFAQRPSDLVPVTKGALLPWPGNSYLALDTQDELYAVSADSGTPAISIIQEFDTPW